MTFKTLAGDEIDTEGEVTLDIDELGRHTLFVCKSLSYPVLLGADVMVECVINLPKRMIQTPRRSLSIHSCESHSNTLHAIAEVNRKDIPAFLEHVTEHPVFREELGHCVMGEPAVIKTIGPPIKQKAYRLPLTKRAIVEEEVEKMLDLGVIRPSQSPYASPITLVNKKDGTVRFCVDFRRLNAQTVKDAYPIPLIQSIFDDLRGSTIFSTLDLRSGYWQMDVAPEDIPKTAFTCHKGLYEFVRLPFGLANAPGQFQRLMNRILEPHLGKRCLVYIDDVVVYSKDITQHAEDLRLVLETIHEAGMTLKLKKCFFAKTKVDLLGYTVSGDGITAQEDKTDAIRNMPPPTNVKAVQRFLGMTGYYRQLIPRYADIAAPLFDLTKKNSPWKWEEDEENAFRQLKDSLASERVMAPPDLCRPYRLYTDASNIAVGAVLTQVDDNGIERPIHYVSKALSGPQRRWATIEKELFSVVHALRKLQPYLQGADLTILTDHKPLRSIFQCELKNSKLQRWAMLISEFSPKLEYRKGKDNVRADMLSRLPPPTDIASIQEVLAEGTFGPEQQEAFPVEWEKAMMNPDHDDDDQGDYVLPKGELYSLRPPYQHAVPYPRLMAPPSVRQQLLSEAHEETGHRGRHALLRRLQSFAVWPGMMQDIKNKIENCPHCAANACKPRATRPQITETPHQPFEIVGIDLTGPFLPSHRNNRYLLSIVDHHSGWAEAFPIPDKRASTVWNMLCQEFFARYGHPRVIISDNGAEFNNEIFRYGCSTFQIEHRNTTPQHPQSNGVAERFHRVLKTTLRKLVNNQTSDWEKQLAPALWAYRVSDSEARGTSPYQLLYGITPDALHFDDPDGRYELMHSARQHAMQIQEKAKESRQRRSRLLPREARNIRVHDLITIDHSEPVTLSHLRDHGYRVVSVRGKVIGYVPVNANQRQHPKHVHIDRVKVVHDIDWRTLRPRPLRRRGGPDVRRAAAAPPPDEPITQWQARHEGPLRMRLIRQPDAAQQHEREPHANNADVNDDNGNPINQWEVHQQQERDPLKMRIVKRTPLRPSSFQQQRCSQKRSFEPEDDDDVALEPPTGRQAYDPDDE